MVDECPVAGIQITVTGFVPTSNILTSALQEPRTSTSADITLVSDGGGVVSQATPNGPIRVDHNVVVDLVFQVDSTDGHVYFPVGVSFFSKAANVGVDDFPRRHFDSDGFGRLRLTIRDANLGRGNYEFKLIVQQESTGDLGVIDPQVGNGFSETAG